MISIVFPSVFLGCPDNSLTRFNSSASSCCCKGKSCAHFVKTNSWQQNESNIQEYPNRIKHNGDAICFLDLFHLTPIFPPLHQLVCMEMVQNTLSWNILQTFAEKRPTYIVLPTHHKSHPLNLAHHISHHMTFYNINSSINFRFHCARQYPKLASHIFKYYRCAKVGGFLHQPQPFEPSTRLSSVLNSCKERLFQFAKDQYLGIFTHLSSTSRESIGSNLTCLVGINKLDQDNWSSRIVWKHYINFNKITSIPTT